MKHLKKSVILMLIFVGLVNLSFNVKATDEMSGSAVQSTEGVATLSETELKWADAKNATLDLVEEEGKYYIEVKGITPISGHNYYVYFFNDNKEPSIDKIKEMHENRDKERAILEEKGTNTLRTTANINGIYVQNKEFYMAIVEHQVTSDGRQYKVGKYGTKLERVAIPKNNEAFSKTIIANQNTEIATIFPMESGGTQRKMTIKIGKITDNEILKKIKNKEKTGFEELLKYAKSNSTIYSEKVNINSANSTMQYHVTGTSSINLEDKIENEDYYFLYVEADNQNGEFITGEAVTLAKGKVRTGNWNLVFYGSEDFNMDELKEEAKPTPTPTATPTPTPSPTPGNDDTAMKGKLPQTGINMAVIFGALGMVAVAGESFRRYRKNRV